MVCLFPPEYDNSKLNRIIGSLGLSHIEIGTEARVKAMYKNGAIYINKAQYFDGVEEQVWNEYIGAYQPLQKWMKDRKGTILTGEDIGHYQKMISAMKLTQNIMAEIDKVVQF